MIRAGRIAAAPTVLILLVLANIAAWAWAALAFRATPALLEMAMLAWLFGLRHAVDADHIAAIDNAVRKLMGDGQRPGAAGLFFSLGHSTIVVILAALAALAAGGLPGSLNGLAAIGSYIGTGISALFLLIIATSNLRALRLGHNHAPQGLLTRLLLPLFNLVRRSRDMYLIGFLFGLGFDTATEIGLLGLSAASIAHDLAFWRSMALPALFTAGMSLLDTADSMAMTGAYGWAMQGPARRRGYNTVLTLISTMVALVLGGVEMLSLCRPGKGLAWNAILYLNNHWSAAGGATCLLFLLLWLGAITRRRLGGKTQEHA